MGKRLDALVQNCKDAIDEAAEEGAAPEARVYNGKTDVWIGHVVEVLEMLAPSRARELDEYMSAAEKRG